MYVETSTAKLLFDAGISGIRAERGLASHDRDIREVDAVLISHDHSDHIASIGVFQRKYGLPVYVTPPTLSAALRRRALGAMRHVRHFDAGETLRFGSTLVETLPTPHDGVDGVAFTVQDKGRRLGVLTDLGHPYPALEAVINTLDAVFLESNYDPEMLHHGYYPWFLKRRISGPGGHLSNPEAAALLAASGGGLKWACLAHLSENNNTPEKALETHRRVVGDAFPLLVASRDKVGPLLQV